MSFNAVVVERDPDGRTHAGVRDDRARPSARRRRDGGCRLFDAELQGRALSGLGRRAGAAWPHVPGIDFAGRVAASDDPRYRPGDPVVLTGWRVGEVRWGGYAEKARVKADWLVPLPAGLTTRQAMAVGTAGLTAMLAMMALEEHGLRGRGRCW